MKNENIVGVDHIAIQLPNMEEGLHFFRDLLGFRVSLDVTYDGYQIIMLKAGKIELELWENKAEGVETAPSLIYGVDHLAIEVKDLDAALALMHANDIKVLKEPYEPTHGIREAIFLGPAGVRVQFVEQNVPLLIWRSIKGDFRSLH